MSYLISGGWAFESHPRQWLLEAVRTWRLWSTNWVAVKLHFSRERGGLAAWLAETWQLVRRRLVTRGDRFHMHKVLGVLSLGNMAHKLGQLVVYGECRAVAA